MSADGAAPARTADGPRDPRVALARERASVEAALERALRELGPRIPERLEPAVRYGVLGGGKRVRPILCVAACRACGGGDGDGVHDLAVSLELIHAYSLLHDDLPCMDDAELRRGRPAAHQMHGEEAVMEAGALLIPAAALRAWAAARALGLDPEPARQIVRILCRAAGAEGMVGGQVLDLAGEGRRLSEPELHALHRRKTGALLAAAPRLGALAAGAEADTVEAFGRYGEAVELAFQIADDILDATATAGELGKHPSDRKLEKSTYVSLLGLEGARERAEAASREARRALDGAGIEAPLLADLASYVVRRRR